MMHGLLLVLIFNTPQKHKGLLSQCLLSQKMRNSGFSTIQNPSKLVKASFTYKLKGYWLDLQDQSNYKLLTNQDYVTITNMIENGPYGPLYFLQRMEISNDQYFNIPEVFSNAIFAALRNSTII